MQDMNMYGYYDRDGMSFSSHCFLLAGSDAMGYS